MKKTRFLVVVMVVLAAVAMLVGCATLQKKDMWEQGDWNWCRLKWVAQTHLDGDVPHTTLKTQGGTVLIFQ